MIKMFLTGVRATFYQENILVLDGDQFIEDPVSVLQSVERFLHIPPFFSDQHFTHNGHSSPREIKYIYYKSIIRTERLPVF